MPLIDIHVHTARHSSCSFIEAAELLRAAARRGLDGLIVTEHGRTWPESELAELARRGPGGILLFSGQEVRTYREGRVAGDVLVYGVARSFSPRLTPEDLLAQVRAEGGVAVAAHPFRGWLGLGRALGGLALDGLETLSGNCSPSENDRAARAARDMGLPALGGSDAHSLGQLGLYATDFEGEVRDLADVVAHIRAGRCRPVPGKPTSGGE